MSDLPSGTVTLLFTDIEGSTRLLQHAGDSYPDLLAQHRRLLRTAFERHEGSEVDSAGDAFFVAFATAHDAVAAAEEAQRALAAHRWPQGSEIRVRIGLHTGEPRLTEGRYVGLDVHRAARVMAAGHGGQVLVSQATRELLGEGDQVRLRDLGQHRLKDLSRAQHLYQLEIDSLPSEFPPLETLDNRPTNLPVQPTLLIGRDKELVDVEDLIRRDDVRLLTLTGAGGTGKTRLALQAAADLIEEFSNGVFFVGLADITDSDLVVPTIAQTLGLREQGGGPLIETMREYLRNKQMLLLLDNFEQVVKAAPAVTTLLSSAPSLTVLITSRTPLHLSGERTYDVPPLALPDPARLPSAYELTQNEAVALFVERAQAARSGFVVTKENAPDVAEICVRLDGLPLALELAAAHVRVLPPHSLLSRLDDRLKFLTRGAQDLDTRQRTLRATVEWSYQLLSNEERTLFARLGVFVGGCRLDAVEAVCGSEDELGINPLAGVTLLVENSLLRQAEDADGEPRFWMLETIREYAVEQLNGSRDAESIRNRHADWFFSFAEILNAELPVASSEALARFERERPNIRAAIDASLARSERTRVARALHIVMDSWTASGLAAEGSQWSEKVLERRGELSQPALLDALVAGAEFARMGGDFPRAAKLHEEVLELAISMGSAAADELGHTLASLADIALLQGDVARAREYAQQSLEQGGGERAIASIADIALHEGDLDRAAALYRQLIEGFREWHAHNYAEVLASAAEVQRRAGDLAGAAKLFRQAVGAFQAINNFEGISKCLDGFAALAAMDGDLARAGQLAGAAAKVRDTCGEAISPQTRPGQSLDDLPEEALNAGREMTLSEAIQFALEADSSSDSDHMGSSAMAGDAAS